MVPTLHPTPNLIPSTTINSLKFLNVQRYCPQDILAVFKNVIIIVLKIIRANHLLDDVVEHLGQNRTESNLWLQSQ